MVIGFYGTMTNRIFLSVIPTLISAILFLFVYINHRILVLEKYHFYFILFFLFAVISTLVYYPRSFLLFEFYRYDGNFFISYFPLLLFPFIYYNFNALKILKSFAFFIVIINTIIYIIYLFITKGGVILHPAIPGNSFTPFFKATNAAGGFYSIVASIFIIFYYHERKIVYLVCLFLTLLFLWSTTSRGSILGVLLGGIFFLEYKKGKKILIYTTITLIILVQAIIIYNTYPLYKEYLFKSSDIAEDTQVFIENRFDNPDGKQANIYIRAFDTWPRATALFLNSPIIGSGFGSVNDLPLTFDRGIPHLFSFNDSKNKYFNDSHAHHSYLHFLAEMGILGLGLFLLFWFNLFKFINSSRFIVDNIVKDYLSFSMFNLSIMSFTEHRITTPSNVLPFIIFFSIALMSSNYKKIKLKQINQI
jgi:O-antigen ligase